jgi:hypothetical protein
MATADEGVGRAIVAVTARACWFPVDGPWIDEEER